MKENTLIKVKSISEYHQLLKIEGPDHPLISVVDLKNISTQNREITFAFSFYAIAIKRDFKGKMRYGQQNYDFDAGMMSFIAPNQVFSFASDDNDQLTGSLILFHPDFLWNTSLAINIKHYDFFSYATNEALFLSEKEEKLIINIIEIIKQEYQTNIDSYSQEIIIAQLELLLKYAERFYQRQFITRKKPHHLVLNTLEIFLNDYCNSERLSSEGIPSITLIADHLNISPNYLSRLLKTLTGQSTKTFVQNKLISLAKEKLSTTALTINQIAFDLGFEHPQSFSKLFKSKTGITPQEFRMSFN